MKKMGPLTTDATPYTGWPVAPPTPTGYDTYYNFVFANGNRVYDIDPNQIYTEVVHYIKSFVNRVWMSNMNYDEHMSSVLYLEDAPSYQDGWFVVEYPEGNIVEPLQSVPVDIYWIACFNGFYAHSTFPFLGAEISTESVEKELFYSDNTTFCTRKEDGVCVSERIRTIRLDDDIEFTYVVEHFMTGDYADEYDSTSEKSSLDLLNRTPSKTSSFFYYNIPSSVDDKTWLKFDPDWVTNFQVEPNFGVFDGIITSFTKDVYDKWGGHEYRTYGDPMDLSVELKCYKCNKESYPYSSPLTPVNDSGDEVGGWELNLENTLQCKGDSVIIENTVNVKNIGSETYDYTLVSRQIPIEGVLIADFDYPNGHTIAPGETHPITIRTAVDWVAGKKSYYNGIKSLFYTPKFYTTRVTGG